MDNLNGTLLGYICLILSIMLIVMILRDKGKKKKHKKHKHRHKHLQLNIHFHNKHKHFKMSLNSITLADKNVHTGVVSVIDTVSGNTLTGTLSNLTAVDSDTTQDTAAVDPNVANTIDVQAVTNTGGSLVNVTADFTSQGNAGIPDGTVFTAVPGQATIINAIPTTPQPALQINF